MKKYNFYSAVTVFLAALAVRTLFVVFLSSSYWPGSCGGYDIDAFAYHKMALGIIEGRGTEGFLRMPGYPVFLSFCYSVFGVHFLSVRIIQAILGALTCYILYVFVCRMYHSKRIAFTAGMLMAFYPFDAVYSVPLLAENATTFLIVLSLYLYFAALKERHILLLILSALLFSMTFMFKAYIFHLVLILSLLIFPVLKDRNTSVKWLVVFLSAYLLAPVCWGYSNYRRHGSFSIMPVGKGRQLLIGTSDSSRFKDNKARELFLEAIASGEGKDFRKARDVDGKLLCMAFGRIGEEPAEYGFLRMKEVLKGWLTGDVTRFRIRITYAQCLARRKYGMLIAKISFQLVQSFLILLALAGYFLKKKEVDDLFPIIPVVYYFLIFLPVYLELRYLIPVMPFVIVFAAIGINGIFHKEFVR